MQGYVPLSENEAKANKSFYRAFQYQVDGPHDGCKVSVERNQNTVRLNTCTGSHSQCSEMGSRMVDTERKDAVPRRHVTLTGSRGRLSGPASPDCTDLFLFPRPHEYLSSSVVKTNLMRYRRSLLPSFFEEFTASSHCLLVM